MQALESLTETQVRVLLLYVILKYYNVTVLLSERVFFSLALLCIFDKHRPH